MKKINNLILHSFYESYAFLMPQSSQDIRGYTHSKLSGWSLVDSFLYTKNFKQILNLLYKIRNLNVKKNKILFILDDDIYFFFENSFKKTHFLTNDLKLGLEFLKNSDYSSVVGGIVYIGKNNEISTKVLNQLHIPFFCFSPKTKFSYDYSNYNMLSFHGSVLYLKLILNSILNSKNLNEKKII